MEINFKKLAQLVNESNAVAFKDLVSYSESVNLSSDRTYYLLFVKDRYGSNFELTCVIENLLYSVRNNADKELQLFKLDGDNIKEISLQ